MSACTKCMNEVGQGDKFCTACGEPVQAPSGKAWVSPLLWLIGTFVLLMIFSPELGKVYTYRIFYAAACVIGLIAAVSIIRAAKSRERKVLGPALSLVLVILVVLSLVADTSGGGYRMKAYNAAAIADLQNARAAVETYHARHKKTYPRRLEETEFKNSMRVDIVFTLVAPDRYRVIASHAAGDKEYRCGSGDAVIYWRPKAGQEELWRRL